MSMTVEATVPALRCDLSSVEKLALIRENLKRLRAFKPEDASDYFAQASARESLQEKRKEWTKW